MDFLLYTLSTRMKRFKNYELYLYKDERSEGMQNPAFGLTVHILFQLLGDIPGIRHNDTLNIRIDLSEDVSIVGSWLGES